ncbi:cytochrome c oxidase subunit II [Rhodopirellula europaea]|jgi:cytochrome c oxidase subunit 2|uniref:Cytochrome aa3 subunit 2 n=1 Tax=Rhodopirellula europaea SH398 TaxID=1263868 RepID=M5SM90_9BACT|nr:cytochrome c oxidase subunit II [Rhodopirellula europaea]EMI28872.1 cytochrome c oxidase, subunit II [Rhodopirellula europaea SH398]
MNFAPSQSALDHAGVGAESIAGLFWVMLIGGCLIWLIVVGLAVYAIVVPGQHDPKRTRMLVIGGGAVFPTIVLTALLTYGLAMLPELQRPAPEGSQVIEVAGVRWWWRVHYRMPDGDRVETANEIHLPVNEPVEFKLKSEDVIHAFWIPSLGGKVDMMPGRENRLKLHPTRVGVYRGVCAEYCGEAHTQMAFDVIVESREDYDEWLRQQASPAAAISDEAEAGRKIFAGSGCGACHSIRGTSADGVVGPDLTHFGSRRSIGASVMTNNADNLTRWIAETHRVKPGVEMPAFETLADDELQTLVRYLGGLQ